MENLSQQQRNRLIVARYWDQFWTNGNIDAVDELCSDDFVQFYPMHGRLEGKAAVKDMMTRFRAVSVM